MRTKLQSSEVFDPLTIQQMLADFGAEALSELMECFVHDVSKAEAELVRCDVIADVAALKNIAHSVKGTAGLYGATRLAAEASRLDAMCALADPTVLHTQVVIVRSACWQTINDSTKYRLGA